MLSKRESMSEPGNTEPKTRWYNKLRRKHKHKTAPQANPQPSACDEGSEVGLVILLPCLIMTLSYNSTDTLVLSKAADIDTSPARKQ